MMVEDQSPFYEWVLKENATSKGVEKMEKTIETGASAKPKVPEMKFRAGAISATVWENQGQRDGEVTSFNTISITRNYKDKKDEWQSTNSLRINDLPRAALVLTKAYEYLVLNQSGEISG